MEKSISFCYRAYIQARKIVLLVTVCIFLLSLSVSAQDKMSPIALRTNLLYGLGTLTPNLGVEVGLAKRSTLLVSGSYNDWNHSSERREGKKLNHWFVGAEYRQWLCDQFNGHFFGANAFYGFYNVSQQNIPFIFGENTDKFRYRGDIYGVGVSYGYQARMSRRWNIEFNAGIGVGVTNYDKFECARCGDAVETGVSRTFVAPTKLGVTLVYLIRK